MQLRYPNGEKRALKSGGLWRGIPGGDTSKNWIPERYHDPCELMHFRYGAFAVFGNDVFVWQDRIKLDGPMKVNDEEIPRQPESADVWSQEGVEKFARKVNIGDRFVLEDGKLEVGVVADE